MNYYEETMESMEPRFNESPWQQARGGLWVFFHATGIGHLILKDKHLIIPFFSNVTDCNYL